MDRAMKRSMGPSVERAAVKLSNVMLLVGAFLVVMCGLSMAEEYPARPVNVTVVYAAGGTMDTTARTLAGPAEKLLGQQLAVTNVGGAGGAVGLGLIAKQKPDGYHLGVCSHAGLVFVPHVQTVTYKLDDFVPVMHYGFSPNAIVVRSDSPWRTLKDLIEYARQNPRKVTYGTGGTGSPMHLAMEFIGRQEGIQWTHVPYQGANPAMIALLGGHITAESGSTEWMPHVKEGKLRLLAAQGEKRMKAFPDVPTLRELGYDFTTGAYFMFVAPKGTPEAIVGKLDNTLHKAMDDPKFIDLLGKLEIEVSYRNAADLKKYLEESNARLEKLFSENKIPRLQEKK
ncbi:MAG TPA: tripartite tricarboxylate transporter substrate binding protein [Syntrophorhabdales bacterium]|nr:tripartite tricarboxylate transporter substrate binding protein [Syntrophorhabdales bacterium]